MQNKFSSYLFHPNRLKSFRLKKALLLAFILSALLFGALILATSQKISRQIDQQDIATVKLTPRWQLKIQKMLAGYPMEKMVPYINRQNKTTAAFVVSVAKKESNWGKRVPVLNGKDCFNYWGYRGKSENVTWDGYTCFSSPGQAVATVSARFDELIKKSNLDTPKKMVVWKCGWSCATHTPKSVAKWISDVNYYFKKI